MIRRNQRLLGYSCLSVQLLGVSCKEVCNTSSRLMSFKRTQEAGRHITRSMTETTAGQGRGGREGSCEIGGGRGEMYSVRCHRSIKQSRKLMCSSMHVALPCALLFFFLSLGVVFSTLFVKFPVRFLCQVQKELTRACVRAPFLHSPVYSPSFFLSILVSRANPSTTLLLHHTQSKE